VSPCLNKEFTYLLTYLLFILTGKEWRSQVVPSHQFDNPSGHQNPSSIPISSYVKLADPVNVGAFRLSRGIPIHTHSVDINLHYEFICIQVSETNMDRLHSCF